MCPEPAIPREYDSIFLPGPLGEQVVLYVLATVDDEQREARVLCGVDFMKAYLDYRRLDPAHVVGAEELRELLQDAGIVHGIDSEGLLLLAQWINSGERDPLPFEAARGDPPRNGDDGRIEFIVNPTREQASYEEDEAGNVDFRRLNLIQNALKDQHVASLRPPTRGTPGTDIFGRTVPANDGRPSRVRLGNGIRSDESLRNLFAEDDGRLLFRNDVLSLSRQYEIDGDVEFGVGTIDFVGKVVIKGSVLDGFEVIGLKGVQISGMVGACRIRSNGDVLIAGGTAGRGEGQITAGGTVQAKYLHEVEVVAKGDVTVRNEIVNCTVRTLGKLWIPHGSIIGGEVTALKGVEAEVLGSNMGVFTHVTAGVDYTVEQAVQRIDGIIAKTEEQIERINGLLGPLLADRSMLVSLSPENRKVIRDLVGHLRRLKEQLENAQDERADHLARSREGRVCQINVANRAYQSVLVRFPHVRQVLKGSYRGPLSVIEDRDRDMVRLVNHFALTPEKQLRELDPDSLTDISG